MKEKKMSAQYKPCIVCRGTGKYSYAEKGQGRTRITSPLYGWYGPCHYCEGTGKVDQPKYRFHVWAEPLDKPAGDG